MTTESHRRQISGIYERWQRNEIDWAMKDRLVQEADDHEVAECQACILGLLAEKALRLEELGSAAERNQYSGTTVSSALIRLLNAHRVALTPYRNAYLC